MKVIKKPLEFGQDLVEYALIFPILFMFLVGIFDLGRVVIYYSILTNAAREGARAGIIYQTDQNDMEAAVDAAVCYYAVGLGIGCPNPSVSVSFLDQSGNGRNDHVRVSVSSQFKPVTPFIGSLLGLGQGGSLTLNSQSTMRIEN